MGMSFLLYLLGCVVAITGLACLATMFGIADLYVTVAAALLLAIGVVLAITRSRAHAT